MFYLYMVISELYYILKDPLTYERVYTGDFFGEYRFETILSLQIHYWLRFIFSIGYIIFEILHLSVLKKYNVLTWVLRIVDLFIIGYFVHFMFIFYSIF